MFQEILSKINIISPLFYQVLYMTIVGSFAGILVYFIGKIFDNKMSAKWKCLMWGIILLTFVIPIRFEVQTDKPIIQNEIVSQIENIKEIPSYNYELPSEEVKENVGVPNDTMQTVPNIAINNENVKTGMSLKYIIINIIVPYIWLFGMIAFILTFFNGMLKINKKMSKFIYENENIERILLDCKKQLHIKRDIKLVLQNYKKVPSIFGILKPVILINEYISLEDESTIRYIFLHELSHYKRKDILFNYALLCVLSIHWFNPVVWFLFKKIRQDIEVGADELATKNLNKNEKKEYGLVLINLLRNNSKGNYAINMLCMSDTGKNMERRIHMIKGKSKNVFLSFIIAVIVLVAVSGFIFIKEINEEHFFEGEIQEESISNEEIAAIENYINEICNNYFSLGRIPQFNNINEADKNWIYGHIEAEETMKNPEFSYYYESSYASKESIESNLKRLFGEDLDINFERDNEYLEYNMFYYDEQIGKYELSPTGSDAIICYVINTVKKIGEEYVVNVIEYVHTGDFSGKYTDLGTYDIIETYKDYDRKKPLIDNGKEIFHIEQSKVDSNRPSQVLNNEVLKRKNEFLAFNVILKTDKNGNLIVKKVEKAEVDNGITLKKYEDRETISGENIGTTLAYGNLAVTLKDVQFFENENKEKSFKCTVDFATVNEIGVNNVVFDYLIYDENNNIVVSSLAYTRSSSPSLMMREPKVTNNYIFGFIKEKYNSTSHQDFAKHNISSEWELSGNISDVNVVSNNIECGLKEKNYTCNNLNIILLNIKYQDNEGTETYIPNTDFSFKVNL